MVSDKSVDSDTQLTLYYEWEGKSLSGLSYGAVAMLENILLRNLTIKGGGSDVEDSTGTNVLFLYCVDVVVQNCYLGDSPGAALWFISCSRVSFRDNWVRTHGTNGLACNFVTHSLFDNNKGSGSEYWDFSFYQVKESTISNNFSSGCGIDGFTFSDCSDNSIFGNVAKNSERYGFRFYGDSPAIRFMEILLLVMIVMGLILRVILILVGLDIVF